MDGSLTLVSFDHRWNGNTAIVQVLRRRNIILAKDTWPGADQLPHEGPRDVQFAYYWRSNFV